MSRTHSNKTVLSILMLILSLSLVLSACGGSNGGSSTNTPAADQTSTGGNAGNTGSEPAPGQSQSPETRTVKHSMGEETLTGTPERVVVLTQEGTEAVLELGIKPVGAVNSGLGDDWFPHVRSQMEGVTELGDETEPDLELILSLKPDLILGNKVRHEEIYSQLKEIAPTVLSEDLAGNWKENFMLYAEALNKTAEGEAAMAAYHAHIEQAKTELGDKLSKQVSLVRFLPQAVRLYMKDTFAGVILEDIGFARPASQNKDEFMEVIGKERMADMDGDIMFYFNADYDEEKGGTKMQEEWFNDPLFAGLNVAKTGMTFKVDEVIWNLSGGIKSANLLVDEVIEHGKKL
ncbi:ABC transporter substrate-binding protein [Paenibacillus tarimensis]|uniref:ABC transporter substrate-binding protein n=1 Tax=Paenibacillus tarimensis TaxID=416012 RepID=UPI001F29B897|nr:iron-siderophore ABC transporter substrate-binding protein [Paenibacillus tarimensis]MCF2942856.1 iron-siderophore ABC transporter substrate-binding protein [Paenibacillus tarimensis]